MLRVLSSIVISLFASVSAYGDAAANLQIARSMVKAINERDLEALESFVAKDVVRHSAATPGVVVSNLAEFRNFLKSDFAAVPDSVIDIEIIFGNDEYVAMRANYSGTQNGAMGPFPPTGQSFELPFIAILRLEDWKISEIWVEWDNLHALTRLGHFTPPED